MVNTVDFSDGVSTILEVLDQGDLCALSLVALCFLMLGSRFTKPESTSYRWGLALAGLTFVGFFAFSCLTNSPLSAEILLHSVIRALPLAGIVLGFAWLVLPIVSWLGRPALSVATTLTGVARQVHSTWAAWRRQRQEARRRPPPEEPRTVADRERAEREAAERAKVEVEAQRRRNEARTRCELYYARHAPEIRKRFSRATFEAYLKRHLGDHHPPEYVEQRAADLLDLLQAHVARADPSSQRRSVEELVRWHETARTQIEALPLNPNAKEALLIQIDQQFDQLILTALEDPQP